jgi:hypothetical protein
MHTLRKLIPGSGTTFTTPPQSTRPPTSTPRPKRAPTYERNRDEPRPTSAQDRNRERVSQWTAGLHSASSISSPDPEAVFDQANSSVAETSIGGTSEDAAGPRYSEPECHPYRCLSNQRAFSVYYRVYAEDGVIPTANPAYTDDLYLGRILPELVTPPHTAANLKHCLSGFEKIDESVTTSLFRSSSSQTPMDDNYRVSIFSYPGPGCKPNEPMALVAMFTGADRGPFEAESDPLPSREGPTPFETRYRKCFEGLFRIMT